MSADTAQYEWEEKEPSILCAACVLWAWVWRTFVVSWISIYVVGIAAGAILSLQGVDVSSVPAVMIAFGPFIYILPIVFHVLFGLFFMGRYLGKGLGKKRIVVYKKVMIKGDQDA